MIAQTVPVQPSQQTYSASDLPDVNVPVEVLRIANRLLSEEEETRGICVLFTSTTQGEGKTLILRHVARAMAKFLAKNVLVIELQGQTEHSLSLRHGTSLETHSFEKTSMTNVTKLVFHAGDAEKYKYLRDHLRYLRGRYDVILVESPPVKQSITLDPVVLSPMFDITLLVFQQKITPSNEITESLALLKDAGAKDVRLLINESSMLDKQVSRWNLPARIPRLWKRIEVLWRHMRSRGKKQDTESLEKREPHSDERRTS